MGKCLDDFLYRNKLDKKLVDEKEFKKLEKAEIEILKRLSAINEAKKVIKDNSINKKSISDAIKVARGTIYYNKVLEKFIEEHRTTEVAPKNEDIDKLKMELEEHKHKLDKMIEKDFQNELLKKELEDRNNEIRNLNLQVNRLSKEINMLRKKRVDKTSNNNEYVS